MPRKLKLDDLQVVLLSTASQREDGNVLPVAPSIAADTERVAAALGELLQHKLVAGIATTEASFWREDGDDRYTLAVTEAGCAAIGVTTHEAQSDIGDADASAANTSTSDVPSSAGPASKSATVVALMQRTNGATLPEFVAATGWLPHTTRAALTGLRKKGHAIVRSKRGNTTCYHIGQAA